MRPPCPARLHGHGAAADTQPGHQPKGPHIATYQPGIYVFRIAVTDPKRKEQPFVLQSNVTLDRVMTDQEIAQVIVTASARDYPNARVLRLPKPSYQLKLQRR